MQVTLLGYTKWHTHWYSWNRLAHVFSTLGFQVEWTSSPVSGSQNRIWICWREPNAETLLDSNLVRPGDVIFQKLHPFETEDDVSYGENLQEFFRDWHWPVYRSLERMVDNGSYVFGFGCHTRIDGFTEKARIVNKLRDRIFWMPYGPVHYSLQELQHATPVLDGFEYDLGYVGSRWGRSGMGNLDTMARYLDPLSGLLSLSHRKVCIAGGIGSKYVTEDEQKIILRKSRLCPIVHAPFWQMEQGVQDRFWMVFASGRFGVVDNEGVYEYFRPSEVVYAASPGEYLELSLYYLRNVDKQTPFIERVQERIKKQYNLYVSWRNALNALRLL